MHTILYRNFYNRDGHTLVSENLLLLFSQTLTFQINPYCRLTFDGWSCWPNTQAGSIAYAPCPNFITGFDTSQEFAHKLF
ncbi:hypothetical protein ACFW04_011041 [Cataglyphis niger]